MKHVLSARAGSCAVAFCVLAGLGAARSADAQSAFGVNVVDAGLIPGGTFGAPLTWSPALPAYQSTVGGNTPPTPNAVFSIPSLGFDTYLALDANGPTLASSTSSSADGYQSSGPTGFNPPTGSSGPFLAGACGGTWYNVAVGGGFVDSGSLNRIFLAQITLRPGSSAPVTDGLFINVRDFGVVSPNGQLGAVKFGIENASNAGGLWGQYYYLERVGRSVSGVNATFNGGTAWEIYVRATTVPTPGFGGALLAGVCVGVRRRR